MKTIYFCLFFISTACFFSAFSQGMKINQSTQIKELMEVKKEFGQLEKTFQIQIYNGNVTDANNEMKNASAKLKMPVTITFETPNYKVRVGKFRSRIEAEKAQTKIRAHYPVCFVIPPY